MLEGDGDDNIVVASSIPSETQLSSTSRGRMKTNKSKSKNKLSSSSSSSSRNKQKSSIRGERESGLDDNREGDKTRSIAEGLNASLSRNGQQTSASSIKEPASRTARSQAPMARQVRPLPRSNHRRKSSHHAGLPAHLLVAEGHVLHSIEPHWIQWRPDRTSA